MARARHARSDLAVAPSREISRCAYDAAMVQRPIGGRAKLKTDTAPSARLALAKKIFAWVKPIFRDLRAREKLRAVAVRATTPTATDLF